MCPQRVQKDRSSFAGLVGGIAEKRDACGSVRTWGFGHSLHIPQVSTVASTVATCHTQRMSFESQSSLFKKLLHKS